MYILRKNMNDKWVRAINRVSELPYEVKQMWLYSSHHIPEGDNCYGLVIWVDASDNHTAPHKRCYIDAFNRVRSMMVNPPIVYLTNVYDIRLPL